MRFATRKSGILGALLSEEKIAPESTWYFQGSQRIYLSALVAHVAFLAVFAWLGVIELALFNILSILLFALSAHLNRNGYLISAFWPGYLEANTHAALATVFLGWDSGFQFYLLVISAYVFFIPYWSVIQNLALVALPAINIIFLRLYTLDNTAVYRMDSNTLTALMIMNIVGIIAMLSFSNHFYARTARRALFSLRRTATHMEKFASTDSLTQLPNRWATQKELDIEASRIQRNQSSFVVALVDLDEFKTVNDRYGHTAGDEVLIRIGQLLLENLRQYDRIGRWGGEEFLIIFPNTSVDEAECVAEKLRALISQEEFKFNGDTINVTGTFGLSSCTKDVMIKECVDQADRAMYFGKRHGKNRTDRYDRIKDA